MAVEAGILRKEPVLGVRRMAVGLDSLAEAGATARHTEVDPGMAADLDTAAEVVPAAEGGIDPGADTDPGGHTDPGEAAGPGEHIDPGEAAGREVDIGRQEDTALEGDTGREEAGHREAAAAAADIADPAVAGNPNSNQEAAGPAAGGS
jgi:hypothetical protein